MARSLFAPRRLSVAALLTICVALGIGPARALQFWPVPGPVIAEFDPPDPDWLPGHRGVDLAAEPGAAIRSPRPGVVQFVGSVGGVPIVVISHGVVTATYLPATTELGVGDSVVAAVSFAQVAEGDHCAVTCLHWGARANGRYVDPRILLGDYQVVLTPVTD
jgi:murein DD-endopeptidase MepM/ murein hydrolase activator NlpD